VSVTETALWWARVRAAGPQRVPAGEAAPRGMRRLREPATGLVWLLPVAPIGADPAVLEELGFAAPPVERPNETARVLAACLRCCWVDPGGSPWPGATASYETAVAVFRAITMREDQLSDSAMKGALRRLDTSGWLSWEPTRGEIGLGPRVAAWEEADLSSLRELWRNLPDPAVLAAAETTEQP
jgi:hypothetical protein